LVKISKRRKETLRDKLYKRDWRRCHYCRIKEENFIRIWTHSMVAKPEVEN